MNTPSNQRIDALDALRGIAILGILLLNISGFALVRVASFNPNHAGEAPLSTQITWMLLNLFAQGKFLFIFALLFGGTLYLLQQRTAQQNIARLIILMLIGIAHTLLIWEGDILFPYSVCGLFVFLLMRHLSGIQQWRLGLGLYIFGALILAGLFYIYRDFSDLVWLSTPSSRLFETLWKTGDYITSIYYRAEELSTFLYNLVRQYSWFLLGAMLMGASLMASGWLQKQFTRAHYGRVALLLLSISLILQTGIVIADYALAWSYLWSAVIAQPLTMLIQAAQSLGYIALLYWSWPLIQHSFMVYALRCVGKMALTVYLMQSVMGVLLFQRMGWFEIFTLPELMPFVLVIWCINITFAVAWLRYFKQGPIEWIWRKSTTYLARQF